MHHSSCAAFVPSFPRFVALVAVITTAGAADSARADPLTDLTRAFHARTGAKLVFERTALPEGTWFEKTPTLSPKRRLAAARILLREAERYPLGYLGAIGLETFGVFAGCASSKTDGFRPWLDWLGGYRYFGLWNGSDAAIGAYYTDEQLPLTFHHEVFHHVDATVAGRTSWSRHFSADDARFAKATRGEEPYPTPRLSNRDKSALKRASEGVILRSAVSDYSEKAAGEDQAETARYVMSHLPDALLQVVEKPSLPGSQRILHVLDTYRRSLPDGPDFQWFVRQALRSSR